MKSKAQLDLQVLHRARQWLVSARTRLTNQLRAVLLERGVILPKRRALLRLRLDELMGGGELGISARALQLLEDLRDEWASLDRRVKAYDDELAALIREDDQARRLATLPGIGVINATALLAAVGDGSAFSKGRDLAAWLGLTPRQHSTGGRTKLLGISKRGNKYIRTQLIHGARAAMGALRQEADRDRRMDPPAARPSASQCRGGGARRQAGADRLGGAAQRAKLRSSGLRCGLIQNRGRRSAEAAHEVCGGEGQMA